MQLSPGVYHTLVRPKWVTNKYIKEHIQQHFDFTEKRVLDFGSGTGANCTLCSPDHYLGIDPDVHRVNFAKRMYSPYQFEIFADNEFLLEDKSFDYILIIAVLHHISPETVAHYVKEFKRVLKPEGHVIIMEPCFVDTSPINNWFMRRYDKGQYIQKEQDYLHYFRSENFQCRVLKRFKKCFLYNELYFTAVNNSN